MSDVEIHAACDAVFIEGPGPRGCGFKVSSELLATWLADYLREILATRQWQPIETAPRDGSRVLLLRKGSIKDAVAVEPDRTCCGWGDPERGWYYPPWDPPTHWMPLPATPQENK